MTLHDERGPSAPTTWLDQARAHAAAVTDPAREHPADQALAIADFISDLAELRLLAERALGLAMLGLADHRGRALPDEPPPERRELRVALGLNRTDLSRLTWLAGVPAAKIEQLVEVVRARPPTRVWSVRMLKREYGGEA